jgi:hypothetical protein
LIHGEYEYPDRGRHNGRQSYLADALTDLVPGKRDRFGKHKAMTRRYARRFSTTVPRILAILSIVLAQGTISVSFAQGQSLRPSVRIAYVHGGNIWLLSEPSGRRTRLTNDGHDYGPHWIAGGHALLFRRGAGGVGETWRWQPGKSIKRLRDGRWSPDGTSVAITRIARQAGSPRRFGSPARAE